MANAVLDATHVLERAEALLAEAIRLDTEANAALAKTSQGRDPQFRLTEPPTQTKTQLAVARAEQAAAEARAALKLYTECKAEFARAQAAGAKATASAEKLTSAFSAAVEALRPHSKRQEPTQTRPARSLEKFLPVRVSRCNCWRPRLSLTVAHRTPGCWRLRNFSPAASDGAHCWRH